MYVCFGKIINLNMIRYLTHFQIRVEKIWQTWLGRELHYLCSCCCFRLNLDCQRLKPGPQLHRVAGDAAIWISFTPEAVLSPQQDRGARRQCFRWRWGNPGNVCQLCFYPQYWNLLHCSINWQELVDLSHNRLDSISPAFMHLRRLKYLHFSNNNVTGLPVSTFAALCEKLVALDLEANALGPTFPRHDVLCFWIVNKYFDCNSPLWN